MTVVASPNPLIETGVPQTGAPAPANLGIAKTDNKGGSSITGAIGSTTPGFSLQYTITVTNSGSSAANGVLVNDPLSSNADLNGDTYTATQTGGASGFTAAGSGDINDTVNLPGPSSITYTVTTSISCSVNNGGPNLTNTATLTPPSGPVLSATDSDTVGTNEC